jgi:F0F1-type ATP synthase membrane subunit b/b'
VDFAVSEQVFKHWTFRTLAGLLIALVGAFLGIDIWFSQKVGAAGQQVAKMQEQVNGARLAIYEKASELNKTLEVAREDLLKSRDAANDILKNDRNNAQKEVDWVKGTVADQIKKEGSRGSGLIKTEEDNQIERLRNEATQKVAHIGEPWAIWLLGTSWVPPGLALLFSIVALIVSIRRR